MKNEKTETLETALKELIRHIRDINELENLIDEKWGVRLIAGFIPGYVGDSKGEVNVRRGIEEIEKALGRETRLSDYSRYTKELRHNGIKFIQYADDKTKTFVKAGCQPPKVRIVEDTEDGQENKD